MNTLYQEEQNKLFDTMLTSLIDRLNTGEVNLELYITGQCNQNCTYCYLTNYGKELYPYEIRNTKVILENIQNLYDYLVLKGVTKINRIDIFSGEIIGTDFANEVLKLLLKYVIKFNVNDIMIPSNMSFCNDPNKIKIVENYISLYSDRNCILRFSSSYDGPCTEEENRPLKNGQHKSYIDDMMEFCKRHDFGYHPMISASTIEKQIENYDSWLELLKKHYSEQFLKDNYGLLMQLEVRNNDWTEPKILEFLKWLNHVIEVDFKFYFDLDLEKFSRSIFYPADNKVPYNSTYFPYRFRSNLNSAGCNFGSYLFVRLGDLAIVPCHRTSYQQYIFGKIKKSDTGFEVEGLNTTLMNSVYRTRPIYKPKCDTCDINSVCIRSCYGSNYEALKDLYFPAPNVCNLERAKYIFICLKYEQMGVFNTNAYKDSPIKQHNKFIKNVNNVKEFSKWEELIYKNVLNK